MWDVVGTNTSLGGLAPAPSWALLFLDVRAFVVSSLDGASSHFSVLFVFVFLVLVLNIKLGGVWDCDT